MVTRFGCRPGHIQTKHNWTPITLPCVKSLETSARVFDCTGGISGLMSKIKRARSDAYALSPAEAGNPEPAGQRLGPHPPGRIEAADGNDAARREFRAGGVGGGGGPAGRAGHDPAAGLLQPVRAEDNSPAINRWVFGREGSKSRQGRQNTCTWRILSFAPCGAWTGLLAVVPAMNSDESRAGRWAIFGRP